MRVYGRVVCEAVTMWRMTLILCLFVCARVTYCKSSFNMYVNRIRQLPFDSQTKAVDTLSAEYRYVDGDLVEVACICLKDFVVEIKYEELEKQLGVKGTPKFNNNHKAVGLRTKLRATHDRTRVDCIFTVLNKKPILCSIIFVLENKFDGIVNVQINGYALRYQSTINNAKIIYYNYFEKEHLDIEWQSKRNELHVTKQLSSSQYQTIQGTKFEGVADEVSSLKFDIPGEAESVNIILQKFTEVVRDYGLTLNANGSLLDLYEFTGTLYTYYEFQDGDTVTLNCSAHQILTVGHHLIFDDEARQITAKHSRVAEPGNLNFIIEHPVAILSPIYSMLGSIISSSAQKDNNNIKVTKGNDKNVLDTWHKNYLIKQTTLRSSNTSNPLTCILKDSSGNILSQVFLYFHEKIAATNAPLTEDDSLHWILAATGGVICIVVVTLATVWYVKKRNRSLQANRGDDHLINNEDPIPPYPLQWETLYTTPVDQRLEDTTYCEVYKPVPRALATVPESGTPDLNYATLDLAPSARLRKMAEESPYADVLTNVDIASS